MRIPLGGSCCFSLCPKELDAEGPQAPVLSQPYPFSVSWGVFEVPFSIPSRGWDLFCASLSHLAQPAQ